MSNSEEKNVNIKIRTRFKSGTRFEYPMLSEFIEDLTKILNDHGDYPISIEGCEWTDEINVITKSRIGDDIIFGAKYLYSLGYTEISNNGE